MGSNTGICRRRSNRTVGWWFSHCRRGAGVVPLSWRRGPILSRRFGGCTFSAGRGCRSCRSPIGDLDHDSESPYAMTAAAADEEPGAGVCQRHHRLAIPVGGYWIRVATPGEIQLVHLQYVMVRCVAEHCHVCQTNEIVTIQLLKDLIPLRNNYYRLVAQKMSVIFLRFTYRRWKKLEDNLIQNSKRNTLVPSKNLKKKMVHRISSPFSLLNFLRNQTRPRRFWDESFTARLSYIHQTKE